AEPQARLALNDYSLFENNALDTQHLADYFAWVQSLQSAGAPLSGVGSQSHFGSDTRLTDIDILSSTIDRFAALGMPIDVTEFDFSTTDEQLQADYTRDYLTYMFSRPEVN